MIKKLEYSVLISIKKELELIYFFGIQDYRQRLAEVCKEMELEIYYLDKDVEKMTSEEYDLVYDFNEYYDKRNKIIKSAVVLLRNKQKLFQLIAGKSEMWESINIMFMGAINIIENKQNVMSPIEIQYETLLEACKIIDKYCRNYKMQFAE